jgi:type IV secretory pathway TrbD component
MLYGYMGGPLGLVGISWYTMGLGAVLWAIASVWAMITVHNARADMCESKTDTLCRKVTPSLDESDPLDEVTKFQ